MKYAICVAIFVSFALSIVGQKTINYNVDNGLPSNHVYIQSQDSEGYMWICTNRGLAKFDGSNFKIFTTQDGLPNNDIYALFPDKQGRIWFFSKSNVQGYIKNDVVFTIETKDGEVFNPNTVNVFLGDKNLWVSQNGVYYAFDENGIVKNGDFDSCNFQSSESAIWEKLETLGFEYEEHRITVDPEKGLLYVFSPNHLSVLDSDFDLVKKIELSGPAFPIKKHVDYVNPGMLSNNCYSFILNDDAYFVNVESGLIREYSYRGAANIGARKRITYVDFLQEIQVHIGNELWILNSDLELLEKYDVPLDIECHLCYRDRAKNLWMCDVSNGLTLLTNNQYNSEHLFKNEKVNEMEWIEDKLYISVEEVGYFEFSEEIGDFRLIKSVSETGSTYTIREDIVQDRYAFNGSPESFFFRDGLFETVSFSSIKLPYTSSTFNFKDMCTRGNELMGVHSGGFVYFNFESESGQDAKHLSKFGLSQVDFAGDKIYVGGADGFHVVGDSAFEKPDIDHSYLKFPVNFIQIEDDFVMVGTSGRGIYLLKDDALFPLFNTDGLMVQKILRDDNILWVATQEGVKKIALDLEDYSNSQIINSYYKSDGLIQNNTNDIIVKDDFLYASCDEGLAKINLKTIDSFQELELRINTDADTLELKYHSGSSHNYSFQTLDYVNQKHLTYQYRLLPLDDSWHSITTNSVNFNNLTPELYTLEVKVENQHGSKSVKRKYIDVIPLWWQELWAKMAMLIVGILVLAAGIVFILKRIRRNEEYKAQESSKIINLELQALRSQMNPHFVHNSLNAIQYFIQRNEVDLSEEYLVKFSKLVRMFFENSRNQHISIKEEIELLTNYLQIEQLRFEDKLEYEINLGPEIEIEETLIPSMILQPIVENAVNHGIFHKRGVGKIQIVFSKMDANSYKVSVDDDGIGIAKSKELHERSSKNYQSKSSMVIEERLALLKQSKDWDIEYAIQDKSEFSDGTGTLVTLIVRHEALRDIN